MTLARMTLASEGTLDLGAMRLEYRMIGPHPHVAPTIVMLHEGLGCVGLWGDFPDQLQAATGAGFWSATATAPRSPRSMRARCRTIACAGSP